MAALPPLRPLASSSASEATPLSPSASAVTTLAWFTPGGGTLAVTRGLLIRGLPLVAERSMRPSSARVGAREM